MKTVIIGGIAAGFSAASQIKRQAPKSPVIVLEKSGDVSYAACGMPYNLFFKDKPVEKLYALPLETIRKERDIDYRVRQEVTAIDPLKKMLTVTDLATDTHYIEGYDFLVYAIGNKAIRLNLPGFDAADVFYFKTLDDTRMTKGFIHDKAPARAVLIGAGYTNLEVADVLCNMKIKPLILEKSDTILPMFCSEARERVLDKIKEKGIELLTGVDVEEKAGGSVRTSAGSFAADLVVVSVGTRPRGDLLLHPQSNEQMFQTHQATG